MTFPLTNPVVSLPAEPVRILAISTSGAWTSVALLCETDGDCRCDSIAEPSGAAQSTRLLAMIGEVLGAQTVSGLSAVAFDAGPGAFTGLRIACSVAQGVGLGADLPLVPVGSHEAAAWNALRRSGAHSALVLILTDARIGQIYGSLCLASAPGRSDHAPMVRRLVGPWLADLGDVPGDIGAEVAGAATRSPLADRTWIPAGNAWDLPGLHPGWRQIAGRVAPSPGEVCLADARAVAELGLRLFREGAVIDPAQAAPAYVRNKVALDLEEQRRLREGRVGMP